MSSTFLPLLSHPFLFYWIRILLVTLIRIRIQLITLMRTRIWIHFITVMRIRIRILPFNLMLFRICNTGNDIRFRTSTSFINLHANNPLKF
jgi:hypothetical protein